MKKTSVAAIDLGATSGRVIVGTFSREGLELTETHRFPNAFHQLGGYCYWDIGGLFTEVKKGLGKARKQFPELASCGVDTWAVDYAMLNRAGRLAFPVHAYRDMRTQGIMDGIQNAGDAPKLYEWTGLPPVLYNTGLQLKETLQAFPALTKTADRVLLLPDYFNFLLTGKMLNEFSVASSTQLLDVNGLGYSAAALDYFGIPSEWFEGPATAGGKLGTVKADGLKGIEVIMVPGHDTSCAFEAIPREGNDMIVSSGTWMLAGAITEGPLLGKEALELGISNERNGDGGYRPLKILVGLWLVEQILPYFTGRPENDDGWAELIGAAEALPEPEVRFDTQDQSLFNPKDMKAAIDVLIRKQGGSPPEDLRGYVRLICSSLGQTVAATARRFQELSGKVFNHIVIVGGGSKNRLLCQKMADYAAVPVVSYNLEATSAGNLGYQLAALGAVENLPAFHETLKPRLRQQTYQPR